MKTLLAVSSLCAFLLTALPGGAATPLTYAVTTLKDSGVGSLRAAIQLSNIGLSKGGTIVFEVSGTIILTSPLPDLTEPVTVDGATAPGFSSSPVVAINFAGNAGLVIAKGASASTIRYLSLIGAGNAALTLKGTGNTIEDNYIGVAPDGSVHGNAGDGIDITSTSSGNLIGHNDPITGYSFGTTSSGFSGQPVSTWLGLKNDTANAGQFLLCGRSNTEGLFYDGDLFGDGSTYTVQYPGGATTSTTVYGPENLDSGNVRLVGSYTKSNDPDFNNHGFVWAGTPSQLPSGGTYTDVDYPGAKTQYLHSTMNALAVGNSDGPNLGGGASSAGEVAYIYDVTTSTFVTNIAYPGAATTTAYGIWYNGAMGYTICGGMTMAQSSNIANQDQPLAQGDAFIVDYEPITHTFSNWTIIPHPATTTNAQFSSQFTGISVQQPGVYNLSANSVQTGGNGNLLGSWVTVVRNDDTTFSLVDWVDASATQPASGVLSANSVYGNNIVGVVDGADNLSYELTFNIGLQRSNVISGNGGNGILIDSSNTNIIAMNNIGTDANGSTDSSYGNLQNGIYVTDKASGNIIGGSAVNANNPTGNKGTIPAVIERPPQSNLISGNQLNGVLIDGSSKSNTLEGNFIGTDASGIAVNGNKQNGVDIESANSNSLLGCTFYQNPFVYYNVIGGNGANGVVVNNSNNVTIHANFIGFGADNTTVVANGGDGVLVSGTSSAAIVGGEIPLGNVISGNTGNGIQVKDEATKFDSFNTFAGVPAFKPVAAPNGKDGILITSTGGSNVIQTCVVSGNLGNGIEICGDASGVQVIDTGVGTTTPIMGPIPNQMDGVLIGGTAHNNDIGGFQLSVIPANFFSGNGKYGLEITEGAYNNTVVHTNVGIGTGQTGAIPNQQGGIYLGEGTSGTTIGGKDISLQNTIEFNVGNGLTIDSSVQNTVMNNTINSNDTGIFATGTCSGTTIKLNTIQDNTTTDVDISGATGITYKP